MHEAESEKMKLPCPIKTSARQAGCRNGCWQGCRASAEMIIPHSLADCKGFCIFCGKFCRFFAGGMAKVHAILWDCWRLPLKSGCVYNEKSRWMLPHFPSHTNFHRNFYCGSYFENLLLFSLCLFAAFLRLFSAFSSFFSY